MSAEDIPDKSEIDDYIGWFVERKRLENSAENTIESYQTILGQFRGFLDSQRDKTLADATETDARKWRAELADDSTYKDSSITTKMRYLSGFYGYMSELGVFDVNIIADIDLSDDGSPPIRREVSLPEMQAFVRQIKHPARRALTVCHLKTGMRVAEVCNLDLRDLHLDYEMVNTAYNVAPRPEIVQRPDSIYVANKGEMEKGAVVNGEERRNGNKRKTSTIIPVDEELKRELIAWLDVRPDTDTSALFVNFSRSYGDRLTPDALRGQLKKETEPYGWYKEGSGLEQNVTPHYFRHFFTTHHRQTSAGTVGLPDPVIRYLRGDSIGSDMLERYTQNWGLNIRDTYLDGVYTLFN